MMVRMSTEEERRRAREAVAAAFARTDTPAPERRCPSCGHASRTLTPECPACGKRYDRRLPWLSDRARLGIAAAVLALVAAMTAWGAPQLAESRSERMAKAEREQAERVRREVARLTRLQRPVRGRSRTVRDRQGDPIAQRLAARRELVSAMERAILAEFTARAARREIIGTPPREVICGALIRRSIGGRPVDVGDEEDPGKRRGRYDCTAVQRGVVSSGKLVARFGVPFIGTIDFGRGSWVFCQDVKVPGERGKPLAKVPTPRVSRRGGRRAHRRRLRGSRQLTGPCGRASRRLAASAPRAVPRSRRRRPARRP